MKIYRPGGEPTDPNLFSATIGSKTAELDDALIDAYPGLRPALEQFGRDLVSQFVKRNGERIVGVELLGIDFKVLLRHPGEEVPRDGR